MPGHDPGNFKFFLRFGWDGAKFSSLNFKRRAPEDEDDVEDDMSIVNGLTSTNYSQYSAEPPAKKSKITKEDTVGKFNLVSFNLITFEM